MDSFGILGKLRSPRFKSRIRKNRFLSIPKSSETKQWRQWRGVSVSFLHMRLFKSASQSLLFLWWGLILLLRDIPQSLLLFRATDWWTLIVLSALSMVGISCIQHILSKGKHWPGVGFLHCTPQHPMEWYIHTSISHKKKNGTVGKPICLFFLMKKISAPLFSFSPLKSLCVLHEMPVSCIPLDNYTPVFFKVSVYRSRCGEPTYMEINKSIALKTHFPKWKCYKEHKGGMESALPEERVIFFQNFLQRHQWTY